MPRHRPAAVLIVAVLLAGCGEEAPAPVAAPATTEAAAGPAVDWNRCRIPDVQLPVPGSLFVIDGGPAAPGAEPGRESIRRVDVFVPGDVALLLTARDATAWHVRLGPETKLKAVFASGVASQRITGQGLGTARLEKSADYGDACGRYWLDDGDSSLSEVTRRAFGRPHDALYRMRTGLVVIGGPESFEPDSLGPER